MRSDSGFSMIELLVTIGILGVLTALAVPSFQSSLQKNRASGFANDLTRLKPGAFRGNQKRRECNGVHRGFVQFQYGGDGC